MGNLENRLRQFISNLQGQFVEVSDRTNIYQCMDLAYLWVFCLGYPKATIQKLYAYQVYTQPTDLTRQYFDILENTSTFIPQAGDIAVYDKTTSNIAGHIGVCLEGGSVLAFRCFEQNLPLGSPSAVKVRNYTYPKLLGVLRPKVNTSTPEPIITDQSLYNFGEGFGVIELQRAKSIMQDQVNVIKTKDSKLSQIRAIVGS